MADDPRLTANRPTDLRALMAWNRAHGICPTCGGGGMVAAMKTNPPAGPAPDPQPYRMWCLPCPFTKTGFPVLGQFGKTERTVVILSLETWKRLCADVPQLQTTQFEVGTYDGD